VPVRVAAGGPFLPDLRGLSARDALHAVSRLGMIARIRGAGIVVHQQPPPGSAIDRGAETTLVLARHVPVDDPEPPRPEAPPRPRRARR
jgi:beta-lactam-binding protein with PASTA domain